MNTRNITPSLNTHDQARALLPWFVTGQLRSADRALVEAHLNLCSECQAELKIERRLAARIADLPSPEESSDGWARMQRLLDEAPPRSARPIGFRPRIAAAWSGLGRGWSLGAPWLKWTVAAQFALVLVLGGLLWSANVTQRPAAYRALGAGAAPAAGNVVVIFQPNTTEAQLRQTLVSSHARLVDGPTSADAYVLHVPAAERAAVLAQLRGRPQIALAEPVDAGEAP
jgi:hypothetical protein